MRMVGISVSTSSSSCGPAASASGTTARLSRSSVVSLGSRTKEIAISDEVKMPAPRKKIALGKVATVAMYVKPNMAGPTTCELTNRYPSARDSGVEEEELTIALG